MPAARAAFADVDKVKGFLAPVRDFLDAVILTQDQADALLGPGNALLRRVTRREGPIAARGVARAVRAPPLPDLAGLAGRR